MMKNTPMGQPTASRAAKTLIVGKSFKIILITFLNLAPTLIGMWGIKLKGCAKFEHGKVPIFALKIADIWDTTSGREVIPPLCDVLSSYIYKSRHSKKVI